MARWFSISGKTNKGRVSEILIILGSRPQIPDFSFPIPSKIDELAMLYFFYNIYESLSPSNRPLFLSLNMLEISINKTRTTPFEKMKRYL